MAYASRERRDRSVLGWANREYVIIKERQTQTHELWYKEERWEGEESRTMLQVSVSQMSWLVRREAPATCRKRVLVVSSITCGSLENCDPPNSSTRGSTPNLSTTLSSLWLSHETGIAAVTHGSMREERRAEWDINNVFGVEWCWDSKRVVPTCLLIMICCCCWLIIIMLLWLL
jgi:hypothetical protein